MNRYHKHSGFTLIELSIVLVIIGLIVGGVLVGRELIHAAEIRSVVTDVEKIQSAVNAFKLKYNCLPGDCGSATDFFGNAAANGSSCSLTGPDTQATAGTCNGNGNGRIGLIGAEASESWRFWEQLNMANLYGGKFTGVAGALGNRDAVIGQNVPASRITGAAYEPVALNLPAGNNNDRYPAIGNYIFFGTEIDPGNGNVSTYEIDGWAITGADAQSIDTKYDNGMAGTGRIMSIFASAIVNSAGVNCTNGAYTAPITAVYANLTTSVPSCSLQFKLAN